MLEVTICMPLREYKYMIMIILKVRALSKYVHDC